MVKTKACVHACWKMIQTPIMLKRTKTSRQINTFIIAHFLVSNCVNVMQPNESYSRIKDSLRNRKFLFHRIQSVMYSQWMIANRIDHFCVMSLNLWFETYRMCVLDEFSFVCPFDILFSLFFKFFFLFSAK